MFDNVDIQSDDCESYVKVTDYSKGILATLCADSESNPQPVESSGKAMRVTFKVLSPKWETEKARMSVRFKAISTRVGKLTLSNQNHWNSYSEKQAC